MIILILVVLGLLLIVGLFLVIISSIRREGKWGINLKPISCPKCKTDSPRKRKPTSTQEALWGGRTCTKCGCKMDKWGKEIN